MTVNLTPGHVRRAIDGDTVELYNIGVPNYEQVRLLGVNTPEKNQPLYSEATEFTANWLTKEDMILSVECKRDSFGRLLGTIKRESDGRDLGDDLIDAGLAVKYKPKKR